MTDRQGVSCNPEPADDPGYDLRQDRLGAPFRLAPMDVGDVHLDDRAGHHLEGIEDRIAGIGKGSRIDHHASRASAGFVQPADQFMLGVCLPEDEVDA